MKPCAFKATGYFREQHTALHSFITPAAAALWNMRWQVRGYVDEVPSATEVQIFGRFAAGSGLRAGNLRRVFASDDSWSTQLSKFGEILLLTSFALYEGWLSEIADVLSLSKADRGAFEQTFGSAGVSPAKQNAALAVLSTRTSLLTQTQFQDSLRLGSNALGSKALPHLLDALRAYKAIRNAFAHRSGVLTKRDVDTIDNARGVSAKDVGTRAAPGMPVAVTGQRVTLSFKEAVSCTAILVRTVVTVDAELGGSRASELDILERVKVWPKLGSWRTLPGNVDARRKRVNRLMSYIGVPLPADSEVVANWLKSEGLVWF